MYRLEYNISQDAYHVAETTEPKRKDWFVVLDNASRHEIDKKYQSLINRRIKK